MTNLSQHNQYQYMLILGGSKTLKMGGPLCLYNKGQRHDFPFPFDPKIKQTI
jgi:hypothetical protein